MASLNAKVYTRLRDFQSLYSLMTALLVTPYYVCVCQYCWKPYRTEAKKNTCAQFRGALCWRCGWAWKGKDSVFTLPCQDCGTARRKSCVFWYKSEWLQRLLWNMTGLMENRTSSVLSPALCSNVFWLWRLDAGWSVLQSQSYLSEKQTKDPEEIWLLPSSPVPLK